MRSRSITGKPARQLRTTWTDLWDSAESPGPLPMPLQYMLTSEAQQRIGRAGVTELQFMPVGQIVGHMNAVRPARDVMMELVEGFIESTERLERLVAENGEV